MSYILDALRKADQERSIGDVPDLDTPHWSRRRGGRIRYWVWVAIGLLIINSVLLAFLFNRDDGGESVPEQAQSRPEPRPALQHERVAKPEQAKRMPLKPMARPERTVMARPRQPVPVVAKAPPASKPATVAHGNVAPAAVTRAPLIQQAEPVQRSVPDIPEWNELSLEFRSGFNPPRLDVHVYDEEPSRRFILVDLQRFVEGVVLSGDPVPL